MNVHLGTAAAITDQLGQRQASTVPYAWGLSAENLSQIGAGQPDWRGYAAGLRLRGELGITWLEHGARLYDPQLGRFHAPDPLLEYIPGISPYAYAAGDPVNLRDASGLLPEKAGLEDFTTNWHTDGQESFYAEAEKPQRCRSSRSQSMYMYFLGAGFNRAVTGLIADAWSRTSSNSTHYVSCSGLSTWPARR